MVSSMLGLSLSHILSLSANADFLSSGRLYHVIGGASIPSALAV